MNETRQDRGIFPRYRLEVNMRAAGRFGTARIYDDELCLLAKHRFELLPGILSEILLGNDRIASHEQENIPGRRMHSPPSHSPCRALATIIPGWSMVTALNIIREPIAFSNAGAVLPAAGCSRLPPPR